MNTKLSNKLAIHREVQVFLNTTTATHDLTALTAKIATLIISLNRIEELVNAQTLPLRGVLGVRDDATNATINFALAIAGPVRSYAASHHRPELATFVDLTRQDFVVIRRGERTRLAQRVLDAAQPLATELAAFGVTAAMLTDLKTKIDASKVAVTCRARQSATRRPRPPRSPPGAVLKRKICVFASCDITCVR